MVVKVGINGFGRIGRLAFRRAQNMEGVEIVQVNDLTDPAMLAHLLKYDSTQGRFDGTVEVKRDGFLVNGKFVKVTQEKIQRKLTGLVQVSRSFLRQPGSSQLVKRLKSICMLMVVQKGHHHSTRWS